MTPLVLLHGFTGSPACFSVLLDLLRERDTAERQVHAPELLGHGAAADVSGAHFEDEVDRLARGIAAELREPAHLVGYSLGARVALGLLLEHASLFSGATLIGGHPGLPDAEERRLRAVADGRWITLLEQQGTAEFAALWEAQPLFATQLALPAHVRAPRMAIRRTHAAAGLARALRVLGLSHMPWYAPRLSEVSLRVQLVAGAEDAKFRELAGRLCAGLNHATLHVVPNAGHDVVLESPAALAELLQKGLRDE